MKYLCSAALVLVLASGVLAQPNEYLPRAYVAMPTDVISQIAPVILGEAPIFEVLCLDGDGEPAAFRWQLRHALLPDGNYADSRGEAETLFEAYFASGDTTWSAWQAWPVGQERARLELPTLPRLDDQERQIFYLLAFQVMDDAGVVQIDHVYGSNVAHFRVGVLAPFLAVFESHLGDAAADGQAMTVVIDCAPDTYTFVFGATAEQYGGEIAGLRWGLDLVDPDDPDDPGWNGPASPVLSTTGPLSITSGIHNLVIQAQDHMGGLTRLTYLLTVVTMPDPQDQLPLLLVDDVVDRYSNAWTGPPPASLPFDNDTYRDAFWAEVLEGSGGPLNFDPARDVFDTEAESADLRTLSQYRVVIWNTRYAMASTILQELAPAALGPREYHRYNWLAAYQRGGGNVLLTGSRVVDAFNAPMNMALPVIFESTEGDANGFTYGASMYYRVGFGVFQLPDGSILPQHQLQYGYRDLGLSVFDQMSPNSIYVIYGSDPLVNARVGRKPVCAAMKGLVLDDAFADAHAPAIADSIPTDSTIDWRDLDPAYYDNLLNVYQWGDDEFYENPGDRPTPFTVQICEDGPGGQCIEPMFRSTARFDWIRAQHLAADPNDTWPEGYYSVPMSQLCGAYALENLDTARTDGQMVGFLSYRTIAAKPSGRADVVWGFDPYRLDHGAMTDAIRWVLGEHFGLVMNR